MYIFFSFFTGILIVVSMMLNRELSKCIGMINSIFINYLTAAISSLLLCFFMIDSIPSYSSISNIPLIYFLGGAIGVLTTYLFNVIVHKVSTVYTVILRFIGQVLTSAIIDYWYLNIFSMGKVLGCILFLIGIILNAKSNENYKQNQLNCLIKERV
ncbi:DMT family transporter [Clostridium sp. A1-XYC3]|uniref:DMT family transporter n=1 Tax=Clostridium tanneri TaxID=3037988 RepID=A0ABU4JX89_9CLOT|nr:DMT family transporter [Clostridium sp. A1-XYC3]MDW8802722.1 DMT family transporter [Clostridium sp. A1-XYC3]